MGKREKIFSKFLRNQVLLIGMLFAGDQIFGFFEQNYLNTYLDQVLFLQPLFISLMVSLSAVVGLITNISWGITSDNTRSKYGRRRPYLLFSLVSGVAMILFAFSINLAAGDNMLAYIFCIILDVIIIGITSNAYYVSERSLIPDTVDMERRGRANGVVNNVGYLGLLIAVAVFVISELLFGYDAPGDETHIGQAGHIFALSIGGAAFMLTGLLGFFFIKEKSVSELLPKKSFFTEIKEIFDVEQFKANKDFFKIVLALTVFRTGISVIMPFLFIWIFALGFETEILILIVLTSFVILFGTTTLLGNLADKHGRRKYIPISIIITCIGLFIAPFVKLGGITNLVLAFFVLPFVLVAILGLITPMNAWAQDLIPEDKRGKFFGILNIIFTISQIIGSTIGGLVAQYFLIGGFVPESFVFVFAPLFFLASIPLFLKVKETLIKKDSKE
ncbi:MAG: MFS transporter [Candidatus Hodarchaeota archaeon]